MIDKAAHKGYVEKVKDQISFDMLPILDPVKVTATTFTAPVRDKDMPLSLGPGHAAGLSRSARATCSISPSGSCRKRSPSSRKAEGSPVVRKR